MLRFAPLQSCKKSCWKIFTEVLLGLMVKARRSVQYWCSAEQCEGALGSVWVCDGEHTLQHGLVQGQGRVHLSMCLLLCGNVPSFNGFIQGWIRKPLLHFGTTYSVLYLLCLRRAFPLLFCLWSLCLLAAWTGHWARMFNGSLLS